MEVVVGWKAKRRINLTQVLLLYLCNSPGHNTVGVHHYFCEAVCDSTIVETVNLSNNFLEACFGFSVRLD